MSASRATISCYRSIASRTTPNMTRVNLLEPYRLPRQNRGAGNLRLLPSALCGQQSKDRMQERVGLTQEESGSQTKGKRTRALIPALIAFVIIYVGLVVPFALYPLWALLFSLAGAYLIFESVARAPARIYGIINSITVILGLLVALLLFAAWDDANMVGPSVQPRYSSDILSATLYGVILGVSFGALVIGLILVERRRRLSRFLFLAGFTVMVGFFAVLIASNLP